jgi:hypothetical protein
MTNKAMEMFNSMLQASIAPDANLSCILSFDDHGDGFDDFFLPETVGSYCGTILKHHNIYSISGAYTHITKRSQFI